MTDAIDMLYSPTIEQAIIASLLIDPQSIHEIQLTPEDFYIDRWGMVYGVMADLHREHKTPDVMLVCAELDKRGKLGEIGGSAALVGLLSNDLMAHSWNRDIADYAALIREKAARRRLIRQAQDLVKAAMEQDRPFEETVSSILSDIAMGASRINGAQHWSAYIAQADNEIEARRNDPRGIWGLMTGFEMFDYLTGGLQASELMLVTAPPGVGKSIFVMQLATQLASGERATSGAYYSLEMTGRAVARRALSAESRITNRVLKSGIGWKNTDDAVYYAGLERLATLPIFMADDAGWTTGRLQADLARLKRTEGIKWFIVDYSFMLEDGSGKLNEIEKTALVVNRLKCICKALDLAGVVIHSLNKVGIGGGDAALEAMRGSGQVTYDADLALFMTQPDKQNPSWIRLTFGKGRELEDQQKYFDLMRVAGLPTYVKADITTTDLTAKVNGKK